MMREHAFITTLKGVALLNKPIKGNCVERIITAISFAFIMFAATACQVAHQSAQTIKDNSKGTMTFEMHQNYQQVYRNLSSEMSRCYSSGAGLAAQMGVTTELYNELDEAEILVRLDAMAGRTTYLLVEIKRLSGDTTTITLNAKNNSWVKKFDEIRAYVMDGKNIC